MRRISMKVAACSFVIICILAISQCSDNTLAPFQPQVTSATDNFQLQATGVKNRSATLNYSWENTGTRAVSHPVSWTQELPNHAATSANDCRISRGDRYSNRSSIQDSLYCRMNSPMISLASSNDSKSCM